MNSTNAQLIQRAGEAVKAGNKREARALLLQAVKQDTSDHIAWLGLARVAPTPQASLDYSRRAARLQPDDLLVKKVLAWAEKQASLSAEQPITITQPPATSRWRTAVSYLGIAISLILLGWAGLWAWNTVSYQTAESDSVPTATGEAVLAQVDRDLPESAGTEEPLEVTVVSATATPLPTRNPIQPKAPLSGKAGEPRATWTLTPTPTNTPTPTATPVPTFISADNTQPAKRPFGVSTNEHWIDVNLSTQTLTAYEGDFAVMSTLISSGLPAWPTVTGQFRIYLRYESQTMDGSRLGYDYYLPGVPYVMYFYQDYALHGTYWHSNFGYPMSHGCVNLETGDAKWIYNFTTIGTLVNVHY
ncbi:MAG: L,D-transpeptidase family protein [Ardenticatenaceae bacterium]|nr:L,D-transpeptidase family protein [Ardenticatenaceae bacterium]MCB9445562.1 L,D-transpeptidase family protein [Ardenticatenaceae bacterium]